MKKHILVIVALLCSTMTFAAKPFFKDINATIRAGYSIGGTLPVPMPQGIRSLERFKLGANLALGIDFEKPIAKNFGVMAGLRFELKNMSIDARVKNYHIKFIKGGQMMEGQFTGYNYSDATQTLFSLPIAATYNLKSWRFYARL